MDQRRREGEETRLELSPDGARRDLTNLSFRPFVLLNNSRVLSSQSVELSLELSLLVLKLIRLRDRSTVELGEVLQIKRRISEESVHLSMRGYVTESRVSSGKDGRGFEGLDSLPFES